MKLVRLSSWGLCAVLLAFFVTAATPRHGTLSLAKPFEGRPNASTQPVSSDQWAKVGEWMRANNCGRRYDFVDGMRDGPKKEKAKELITERFRQIDRIKDPDVRNAVIQQLQAQDQIFALQIQYRRNRKGGKPLAEMKAAVEKLIDATVAERNARAAHLHAEAEQMAQKRKNPEFITREALSYFNTAEKPRPFHSSGEHGSGGDATESTEADVAN